MNIGFLSILLLSALPAVSLFAQQTPQSLADSELPSLLAIYKEIHAQPELSMHEVRCAAIVAKELKAAGYQVRERVGKYDKPSVTCFGVVGVMKSGIAVRTAVETAMAARALLQGRLFARFGNLHHANGSHGQAAIQNGHASNTGRNKSANVDTVHIIVRRMGRHTGYRNKTQGAML